MRVALLGASARSSDALGNQLAEKVAFFLERGADVRVYVDDDRHLHPAVAPHCQCVRELKTTDDPWAFISTADLVIADYGQYYELLQALPLLAGGKPRVLFDYHGVTPVHLWGSQNREGVEKGANLRGLVWFADAAIVHSDFASRELLEPTGFPEESVYRLGYVVEPTTIQHEADSSLRARLDLRDEVILLFVGRIAPNKRLSALLESLVHLKERKPAVHAVIIGDCDDVYRLETDNCRTLATELGVADRVHFLGQVDDVILRDAYRSANVFVMPSQHESFCLPVVEAMAHGLPVLAARTSALPETAADAGLTFVGDNPVNLSDQLRRVLDSAAAPADRLSGRIAIVSRRYGTDFAGGAETSLRTIAESLQRAGQCVEVLTVRSPEASAENPLGEERLSINDVLVHRFPAEPNDEEKFDRAWQAIQLDKDAVSAEVEETFLRHSPRSRLLVDTLRERIDEFDAVIVGPYLLGLSHDVALTFPEKTLLLPCFHDEPAARLSAWHRAYDAIAGLLYHSPEEQEFARSKLGFNHPRAVCCRTYFDTQKVGNAARGRQIVGAERYLIYCGRFTEEKNLPLLLDHARRYAEQQPNRFRFVFVGEGNVPIPKETWACNLGFLDDATRRDVIAGAAALVQLSCMESLSLVALDAWAQAVPVIVHSACMVLTGHLDRCKGGRAVGDFAGYAEALDDLWQNPQAWQEAGCSGQEYVRREYGDEGRFTQRLLEAVAQLRTPLAQIMRERGRQRAQQFTRSTWRSAFARIVEEVLHAPARMVRTAVDVIPRAQKRSVSAGTGALLSSVRILNRGSQPILSEGPSRLVIRCQIQQDDGQPFGSDCLTPLPGIVLPGREVPAAVRILVPTVPGRYRVRFAVDAGGDTGESFGPDELDAEMALTVVSENENCSSTSHSLLEAAQAALAAAQPLALLPDNYLDVTEGWLADWKRRIKSKVLNNFKRAYVDVLSRQQSVFNSKLISALSELTEACATLEHAQQQGVRQAGQAPAAAPDDSSFSLVRDLVEELAQSQKRVAALEERLARLEDQVREREMIRP